MLPGQCLISEAVCKASGKTLRGAQARMAA